MAVELGKLVAEVKQRVSFEELSNKTIAVDAYNTIYQFLSIIRQPDGTPLTDSKNRVTSHLSGLFYRTINLLEYRIRPVFIFDGIPPALKQRTIEARMSRRQEAQAAWAMAKEKGMIEEARTYAMASTRINKEIVASSKELLAYMGIPYLQAPSEGEAQASYMVRRGLVYALASQDYDSFLYGADVVIRNLTISGRRKLPKKNVYISIEPERIFLKDLLDSLGINTRQLIMLGVLIGTDYNTGIEKVGPKTALKIVKEHKDVNKMMDYIKERYKAQFDVDPKEVIELFEEPEITELKKEEFQETLGKPKPESAKIMRFMCDEHDFSYERIKKFADKLLELNGQAGQKDMTGWFK